MPAARADERARLLDGETQVVVPERHRLPGHLESLQREARLPLPDQDHPDMRREVLDQPGQGAEHDGGGDQVEVVDDQHLRPVARRMPAEEVDQSSFI